MTTEGIHKFLRPVFYLRKVPDERKILGNFPDLTNSLEAAALPPTPLKIADAIRASIFRCCRVRCFRRGLEQQARCRPVPHVRLGESVLWRTRCMCYEKFCDKLPA